MSTLQTFLHRLLETPHLNTAEAKAAMDIILEEADPCQTAAFLAILKYRGERPEEIAGMVQALEERAVPVHFSHPVLDIVGTGGDMAHTVNISTGSAILAAACGIPIAKHGNRSVSSKSGSADVLEALGINIELPPLQSMEEAGIAFMFAPTYHPSLKKLGAIRRALKLPTAFNILGPLLNPAKAEYALIGVASLATLELMSQVLVLLGSKKRALIFHGCGLDELTTMGPITAIDIQGSEMTRLMIDPEILGFTRCSLKDLQGGEASDNAAILFEVFAGKKGAIADALIFNAAAALLIFGRVAHLSDGVAIARQTLEAGKALEVLEKWRSL